MADIDEEKTRQAQITLLLLVGVPFALLMFFVFGAPSGEGRRPKQKLPAKERPIPHGAEWTAYRNEYLRMVRATDGVRAWEEGRDYEKPGMLRGFAIQHDAASYADRKYREARGWD